MLVRSDAAEALYKTAAGNLVSTAAPFPNVTELALSLRPEAVRMVREPGARNTLVGAVRSSIYLGGVAQHEVALDGTEATIRVAELNPKTLPSIGARVLLEIDADDVVPLAE
jgi:hypothetical protein